MARGRKKAEVKKEEVGIVNQCLPQEQIKNDVVASDKPSKLEQHKKFDKFKN